ncbi:MAG: NifB/NifX family molybdenum-iron cluster-binding protein [Methermicoccaceae archaeon]
MSMKVAITLADSSIESAVDERFGRAAYVALVDSATKKGDVVENRHAEGRSAGVKSAKEIADMGAEVLISGDVGPKALQVLRASGIKVYRANSNTANDAIDALLADSLEEI